MMKKLLILTLVLGMASVSQAVSTGFVIDGSSEYSATPGETVRIDLIADTPWSGTDWGGIVEAGAVNTGGQALAADVVNMGGTAGTVYTSMPNVSVTAAGYALNHLGNLLVTVSAYSTGAISPGTVTISFDYTIGSLANDYWVAHLVRKLLVF
ncbi:unnamed protein product [marine sediment metagenome]|uniref:Uncharacterized protein n=1 Tax=marine sediment metagenome TaxID=412755 RepID=X1PRG1_9ZZZZ